MFKEKLFAARGHIIFLIGLVSAFFLIAQLEDMPKSHGRYQLEPTSANVVFPGPRELTEQEMEWANIAWRYFENNTINETGMVNSVDKYPASTMWDTSSYIMGLIAAYRLDIVGEPEFDQRINQVLTSLEGMPLFEGKLPNKSYNTQNLAMVNYQNEETADGIGWSALDIGRVLVPMNILVWNYPKHTERVRALLATWDFSEFVIDGTLYGAALEEGETEWDLVQEGRLGYEEYAAKSLSLMGLDVSEALRYDDYMKIVNILGVKVVTDNRSPDKFKALNYVVSEPYILDGIEFGWDQHSAELAYRVFDAQRRRYEKTNILTAVSEDNIDQAPYFIYNTVFSDGKIWNTTTETGESMPELKTISTKAAIGWYVLYENEYTKMLIDEIDDLYDPELGWYSGRYEATGEPNKAITANSNGIILEALAYKKFGPLMKSSFTQTASSQ